MTTAFESGRTLPARKLELFFDYSCPYAYLAVNRVDAVAARMGVPVTYKPFLLGGVFKARGTPQNLMNELSPQKAAHNLADMQRFAKLVGVPLRVPEGHPRKTVEALRATLVCERNPSVIRGFFHAYWAEGRDVGSPETITDVVRAAGFEPSDVLARIAVQATKDALRDATDEAVARGVFGAPTFFVDDTHLYWGQDRLAFVEGVRPLDDGVVHAPTGKTVEAYWDYSSPFAYLGMARIEAVAARHGATVLDRPMLLGGLFKSIGQVNVPIETFSAERRAHTVADMHRWAAYHDVPFRFPSRFPMNTVKALRATLALPEGSRKAFRDSVFRAYWAEDRDISDESVLADLIVRTGADPTEILAATSEPELKAALISATEGAVARQVFGAPTFVVGDELFWGQDRLDAVGRALSAS
jgi:2-hydroxychromene-2-carboxylate isomerase